MAHTKQQLTCGTLFRLGSAYFCTATKTKWPAAVWCFVVLVAVNLFVVLFAGHSVRRLTLDVSVGGCLFGQPVSCTHFHGPQPHYTTSTAQQM